MLLLAACAMLIPMAIDMFLPGIPAITEDLNASPEVAVASVSVFFGGLALGQLFFGPWSDRVGRRLPMLSGLIAFFAGALLAGLAQNVEALLAGRILQSLGAASVTVTVRAIVRDLFDERGAAKFFSTLALLGGLAPILAPSIGSAMLFVGSWRTIFLALVVMSAIVFVIFFFNFPESRSAATEKKARESHPFQSYWALLKERRMIGYLLVGGFNSGYFFTYIASSALIFMDVYGMHHSLYSLTMAIMGIGLVGSAQVNRMLLKHWTPAQVLAGASISSFFVAACFIFFGVTLTGGLYVVYPLFFLVVSSTSIIQANSMAGALSVDPDRAGAAAALFGAFAFGSGMVFSMIAGFLYDGTPRPIAGVIAAALIGAALSIRLLALPKGAAQTSAASS